ncbi:filamentous hemagglutinin family protein [Rhodopseudomonas sp. P2A-2r]|uniref:filamentous haemagglutinin family protein n=1 Tax=Rhodopseudomonas sp. P2A-2r TaxID=2991972 RepID=UPI0022346B97|nr:filamentous haemagglutinin family protein [Rhodopseudomonas sp. P2A-2r]UZE50521.1 filamentous hemagglutinin family protein [Rhodopseudomonas sp. P2A-2r]
MSPAIAFDGALNLRTAQSIDLYSSGLILGANAPLDSRVAVGSAYVRLGQNNYASTSQSPDVSRESVGGLPRPAPSGAYLDVSAQLIDIRDTVSLGAGITTLRSAGDIRFVQGVSPNAPVVSTVLTSPLSVTLQAAQIYPATGVRAQIKVGQSSVAGSLVYDPAQVLRIESNGAGVPSVPYSAFGDLTINAGTIEQGGVLRAPLGRLELGGTGSKVVLLPGSVTSVSGAGLQMPYGGTIDGLTYNYDGKAVSLTGIGAGGGSFGGTLLIGLTLTGTQVDVRNGAVLDMSGGGELRGAGFVSGRGGSTDARYASLMQVVGGKITQPGLATNPVYAIVPGAQRVYAPAGGERSALDPVVGQQITLRENIPGLPAGTYTLMPASYALLPGAFRVELNGGMTHSAPINSLALANGSWAASAQLGIANTGIAESLSRQVILTSGAVMRSYSKYDETSYADFVRADALRIGVPRAMIEADARSLRLNLQAGKGADAFRFSGESRFGVAKGGFGGSLTVTTGGYSSETDDIEIVAAGTQATAGFGGVTLDAGALSAVGASRLVVGGPQYLTYGKTGTIVGTGLGARQLVLRSGAVLSAPEVFLSAVGNLSIEQGAGINTLGRGRAAYDAADGFHYSIGRPDQAVSMVAVSNGVLSMLPPVGETPSGNLLIGGCLTVCAGETQIYSEGTIVLSTSGQFTLDDAVRYGTRNLTLAVQGINVGDSAALAAAAAGNVLPAGLSLNQSVLNRLLRGDTQYGAPALQTLVLSAANSVNFYGNVTLDTIDPVTGRSTLDTLVLGTPAIYGSGIAGDVATIRTGNLIWKGATTAPATVVNGGAGTGSGTLNIEAARIEFGYGPGSQPTGTSIDARLALGFANVNLRASDRITANQKGSLSVYQSQGAYQAATGYAYSGGNLTITAPLVTGGAGSVNKITAGGSLVLRAPASGAAAPAKDASLGAELSLAGQDVSIDTLLSLPSGKLTVTAERDLTLTDRATIDMAGRTVAFNDVNKYSWGGDVVLNSRSGSIRQAAGSVIDLSAQNNRGGSLKATALADLAGVVDLEGSILGSTSGVYDAGGTLVPWKAAMVEIRGQRLGDTGTLDTQFAALNQRLNAGGVFGARSFQFKQGDLTIGNDVKAGEVDVSLDNGSLTVIGTIDASGAQVGSIVLAAKNNLTIASGALLDAHGSTLRVDSYGKIIDAPNRAIVDLTSRDGTLTLASGARIDLRHGTDAKTGSAAYQNDGLALGTLELYAGRTGETSGDVRIDAGGALDIRGARSIAVNATWRYSDADPGTDPAASGRPYQVITQDYLDRKNVQTELFMNAARVNGNLMNNKLAGLRAYTDAFHLRPGVEIISATPDGDLVVQGDLDLSKYRYDSVNPNSQKTGVYGSGEPGALTIRAGGNLDIYGSITDGFTPPPATQDDNGWLLLPGINLNGGDIVVPRGGVVIADGTAYEGGTTLNYDLPVKAMKFDANIVIPAPSALAAPLTVPAGTVFSATVRDAFGNVLYAAGTVLGASVTLPADTRFDAGMRLPGTAQLAALVWPAGVPLPLQIGNPTGNNTAIRLYVLNGDTTLPLGALLPAATNIKLSAGVESIDLRPSVNTRQGSLWALAKMLPEGSQSWSVRLVAGADTEAADSRIVQANPKRGDIRLADHHYGMFGKTVPGPAVFTWTQAAYDELSEFIPGIVVGAVITDQFLGDLQPGLTVASYCSDTPAHCQKASFTWTQTAYDELHEFVPGIVVGGVITDKFLGDLQPDLTAIDYCTSTPLHCGKLAADTFVPKAGSTRFSVVRTGAADLELLAGGNLRMDSLYGVYTAGTSSAATYRDDPYNLPRAVGLPKVVGGLGTVLNDADGAYEEFVKRDGPNSTARAWYPTGGGNLTLRAGGDLTGDVMQQLTGTGFGRPNPQDTGYNTAAIGNWLWRQGSGNTLGGGSDQATAWFINFGTYVPGASGADQMVGFTGFGTLGGGNLRVDVGGNAGILAQRGGVYEANGVNLRSEGLVLAVGSTGRVLADGSLSLTGGGDIDMRIGGTLNAFTLNAAQNQDNADKNAMLNGAIVNLRGNVSLQAGGLGVLPLDYTQASVRDTRATDPFSAGKAFAQIGIVLAPGDASYNIATRGDLVIKGVNDPGRVTLANQPGFTLGGANGRGDSWFSLWTAHSAINLFSAGGDLTPITAGEGIAATDLAYVYPSILTAVAASGSLYYGYAADYNRNSLDIGDLLLAPSANSRLEFLAKGSIFAEGFTVSQSTAASAAMATPFRPAFSGKSNGGEARSNVSATGNRAAALPLFAFGPDSASAEWAGITDPARFYAVIGDLVGVSSGRLTSFDTSDAGRAGQKRYQGGPTRMMAGRDIVSSGTPIGQDEQTSSPISYSSADNFFIHRNVADVSMVSAGRDILYSSFSVAGPGSLQISAGRNILMADKGRVSSVGPAIAGDTRLGAGITMLAGTGANAPDYHALLRYLDPANLLPTGTPLDGSGKVAKTYEKELVAWLQQRTGFAGTAAEARVAFGALAPEQQQIFLRQVYFAELTAGGREYNDTTSSRYGSYLRGRAAIAALFPDASASSGDIIMFGGSGVQTLFGGDIQMFTPSGKLVVGVEGIAPPATAGLVTQGSGNIQIYSQGSVLLGLSRIMTTFGGNIIAWTANGDINAGRGAKTTVVYTPPKRVYDIYGNVTLSPTVPSSGAGIATLNPIPEVKAGDIDLIAPRGTIDAGEAGIRVSGNINLAALQIVNAANIQVQGSSSGVPTVQAPSISAALSTSNATAATQQTTTPAPAANNNPSVIIVEVLGYGGGEGQAPTGGDDRDGKKIAAA